MLAAPLYYKGWYHLFYQYNPYEAFWGLISWGHAVSTDLVHWLYLDLAMVPDKWYDVRGVWTGSATFVHGHGGPPTVLYTGSTNESVQVQVLAYPTNPEDNLLRNWTKAPDVNPVLTPPDGILDTDFRDPTTAWLGRDGLWRFGMGSKINDTGIALIYQSTDFVNWTLQEHYLYQVC
jgi:beta-fructofuranosidase